MTDFPVTIFHNPNCGTSRTVLATLRDKGLEPEVVDYLKAGWTKPDLQALLAEMKASPADVLRTRGAPAEALAKLEGASNDAILEAMTQHPILVERPIVRTPKGARLCRPAERVVDLLP